MTTDETGRNFRTDYKKGTATKAVYAKQGRKAMLALTGCGRFMIQTPLKYMDARDSFIPSYSRQVSENCDLAAVLSCFPPPAVVGTI